MVGVSVTLGRRRVLSGVDLVVPRGAKVALIGANGAGKTTLLLTLAGLRPYSGELQVLGHPVTPRHIPGIRERIGLLFNVPEDQILLPRVLDDVALTLAGSMPRDSAKARAMEVLSALGIGHLADRATHALSHGQKLLVALAGCLVHRPDLLLLDEPGSGLDPVMASRVAGILRGLETSMVVATHRLDLARTFCDRWVRLEDGRVVAQGAEPPEPTGIWPGT